MYKLEYLPSARQDMMGIAGYIGRELGNPRAAEELAEELVRAGERLRSFPYANPAYIPIRPLRREYRKLLVRNYAVFYWVDEEKRLVTVARVIYARRDHARILE